VFGNAGGKSRIICLLRVACVGVQFMRTISRAPPIAATGFGTPIGQGADQSVPSAFAVAARALFPHKTAVELAARAGVTERAARRWLTGKREPPIVAIAILFDEITREFR
jgi:hypothetical protein